MTLETKKLTIFGIVQKATKNKKSYWVADTSDGKFSIWDAGLYELLRTKAIGNNCEVGVEGKPDVNGKIWYNLVSLEAVIGTGQVQEKKMDIGESARLRRRTDCMIASKDLVIAKIVPIDKLLDKAQALFDWVEENYKDEANEKPKVETIKI